MYPQPFLPLLAYMFLSIKFLTQKVKCSATLNRFIGMCSKKGVRNQTLFSNLQLLDKDARTRLGGTECMYGDIRDQDFFRPVHWDRLERRELEAPFKPKVVSWSFRASPATPWIRCKKQWIFLFYFIRGNSFSFIVILRSRYGYIKLFRYTFFK